MSATPQSHQAGDALLDRYGAALLGVFGRPKRALVRGEGAHVWDADGNRYLDLLGGIAVTSVGHAHPDLTEAIARQAGTLVHTSNFFTTGPQIELAERLLALLDAPGGSAVFFTNSGTEATEAAIKLARRTGRSGLLATEGCFHGRSTGALALTHKAAYRQPFEPLLPGVLPFVPYGDADALRACFAEHGPNIGAFLLEPILGEGGVVPAEADYLRLARDLTREHGTLLVIDEIQTGIGRTGSWFAHTDAGIVPDAVTLAKGLGGGFPIGALVLLGEQVAGMLTAGQHGTTFGGNPLACAAALAVLDIVQRPSVLQQVREIGAALVAGVQGLDDPLVDEVRGRGLLLGIGLTAPVAAAVAEAGLERGLILNPVREDTIRLAPSLLFNRENVTEFCAVLPSVLHAARGRAG